ncbi:MAG: HNH endonuclease [Chloroflexota bacterium]
MTRRNYIPVEIRRAVREHAHECCEYCLCRADHTTELFVIEHVLPLSKGGTDEMDNLAFSCSGCNGYKYNKTEALDPVNNTVVSLYNPRIHQWHDHFEWSSDSRLVVARTSIGRATIKELRLNRVQLANLRYALSVIGRHPPDFLHDITSYTTT